MEKPPTVQDVDWASHRFTEDAVLCFVRDNDRLLLIHKKTGLGAGKINAPGGRIKTGELPEDAAIREVQEEVGVTPRDPRLAAELNFIFVDGYSLRGFVFMSRAHEGTPGPTPEADPFWCPVNEIPYDRMWADDALWLPRVLAGQRTLGRFIFDGDRMLSHEIRPLIPVTCAVIERDSRFLVAQRSAAMSRPLQWEFPGGKIDDGESPEACIAREIEEELGLSVRVTGRLPASTYTYNDKAIHLMPFRCAIDGGELRNVEHHDVRWVTRGEMQGLDWCDADRIVVRQVLAAP